MSCRMTLTSKPAALGLGVDVLDVGAERFPLLLKPLDPLDQAAQAVAGDVAPLRGCPAPSGASVASNAIACPNSVGEAGGGSRDAGGGQADAAALRTGGLGCERRGLFRRSELLVERLPFAGTACRRRFRARPGRSAPSPRASAASRYQRLRQLRQKPAKFIRSMFWTSDALAQMLDQRPERRRLQAPRVVGASIHVGCGHGDLRPLARRYGRPRAPPVPIGGMCHGMRYT